jgi:hypothetical protein
LLQAERFLLFFVGYSYMLQYLSPADISGLTKQYPRHGVYRLLSKPRFKAPSLWILNVVAGRELKNSKQLMKKCFGNSIIDNPVLKECLLIRFLRNSVSYIWEMPGSNLGQDPDCPHWGFLWFSSVFRCRYRCDILNWTTTASIHTISSFLFVNDIIQATARTKQETQFTANMTVFWLTFHSFQPDDGMHSLLLTYHHWLLRISYLLILYIISSHHLMMCEIYRWWSALNELKIPSTEVTNCIEIYRHAQNF